MNALYGVLKNGTSDSRKAWFAVGNYKRQANEVGGHRTTSPEHVAAKMKELIIKYNGKDKHTFEELLDFHYQFESIYPVPRWERAYRAAYLIQRVSA